MIMIDVDWPAVPCIIKAFYQVGLRLVGWSRNSRHGLVGEEKRTRVEGGGANGKAAR